MQEGTKVQTVEVSNHTDRITIDLPLIKDLPRVSTEDLPKQSGVYFIFDLNNELCYIGQSKNIKQRARVHLNPKSEIYLFNPFQVPYQEIGNFAYIPVKDSYLRFAVEQLYIAYYHPKYNLSPANPQKTGLEGMTVEIERLFRAEPKESIIIKKP